MNNSKKIIEYRLHDFYVSIVKLKNCILRKPEKGSSTFNKKELRIDSYKNTFFGYYDKSPFNPINEDLLLFHANNANATKKPNRNVFTDIILYNRESKEYTILDSTKSWNWQQGTRLHWIDSQHLVFNFYDEKQGLYKTKKIDVVSKSSEIYSYPIQESYKNEFFLSLDYKNLQKTRPDYGYRNHGKYKVDYSLSSVNKIDFISKESDQLFTIEDIAQFLKIQLDPRKSRARINHIMLCPSGNCFIFLFRYYEKYDLKHVLVKYRFDSRKLEVLLQNQMVSHYCWLDDDEIVFWGKMDKVGDYYRFNLITKDIRNLNTGLADGHPWFYDNDFMISDTYPDKTRNRKLLKINIHDGEVTELTKSFESCKFIGETRCDLHPHPSPTGKYIHYDSIEHNVRSLSVYEVKK